MFQIEISSWGGARYLPYAFTEHGIIIKQHQDNFKLLQKTIEELEAKFNRKIENINEIIEYLLSNTKRIEEKP